MNATRSPRNRAYLAADITTATFFPRLVSSTSEPASTWSTMSASLARASAIVYVLAMPLMYIQMYASSNRDRHATSARERRRDHKPSTRSRGDVELVFGVEQALRINEAWHGRAAAPEPVARCRRRGRALVASASPQTPWRVRSYAVAPPVRSARAGEKPKRTSHAAPPGRQRRATSPHRGST